MFQWMLYQLDENKWWGVIKGVFESDDKINDLKKERDLKYN